MERLQTQPEEARVSRGKKVMGAFALAAIIGTSIGALVKEVMNQSHVQREFAKCEDNDGDGKADGRIVFPNNDSIACIPNPDLNGPTKSFITNAE